MRVNHWRFLQTLGVAAMLSACSPGAPPGMEEAKDSGAGASAAPRAASQLAQSAPQPEVVDLLNAEHSSPNHTWTLAEGISVSPQEGDKPVEKWTPFRMTAAETSGMHRVGGNFEIASEQKTYEITVWAGAEGSGGLQLELAGNIKSGTDIGQYGVAVIDLKTGQLAAGSPGSGSKPDFKVTSDRGMSKITTTFTTSNKLLTLNLALTNGGEVRFDGSKDQSVAIYGIKVAPQ